MWLSLVSYALVVCKYLTLITYYMHAWASFKKYRQDERISYNCTKIQLTTNLQWISEVMTILFTLKVIFFNSW